MEKEVVVVGCIVGFLGLLSAALGFAAEATRIRASEVVIRVHEDCIYPKSSALYLGLVSAASLALAQAILNFSSGCICCKRNLSRFNTNWNVALISFAVSWFTFIIAFLLLMASAALNDKSAMESIYFGKKDCYVLKAGVFSGGAVLSLSSVSLGIIYYVALHSPKTSHSFWSPQNHGIALGQPQIPRQCAEPAFLHEDTYNRQRIP